MAVLFERINIAQVLLEQKIRPLENRLVATQQKSIGLLTPSVCRLSFFLTGGEIHDAKEAPSLLQIKVMIVRKFVNKLDKNHLHQLSPERKIPKQKMLILIGSYTELSPSYHLESNALSWKRDEIIYAYIMASGRNGTLYEH